MDDTSASSDLTTAVTAPTENQATPTAPPTTVETQATPGNPLTIKTATNIVSKITNSPTTPEEYCVSAGIDLVEIYKELLRLATCSMVTVKDRDGDLIELGPDNKTRLPAIGLILELNKHIKDKSVATQVAIFNDPEIMRRAEAIVAQRGGERG
jgi:hypothetical protein